MSRLRWQSWTFTAWLAVIGIAFVPTVSRTLAFWQGADAWIEICSAQGMLRQSLQSLQDDDAGDPAPLHDLSHCPLCVLAGTGMAPAPTPGTWVSAAMAADTPVRHRQASTGLRRALSPALPRAPPTLS